MTWPMLAQTYNYTRCLVFYSMISMKPQTRFVFKRCFCYIQVFKTSGYRIGSKKPHSTLLYVCTNLDYTILDTSNSIFVSFTEIYPVCVCVCVCVCVSVIQQILVYPLEGSVSQILILLSPRNLNGQFPEKIIFKKSLKILFQWLTQSFEDHIDEIFI